MLIKKTFQGEIPNNKVLNTRSDSQTDTYSCDYLNNNGGGLSLQDVYPVGAIYISAVSTDPFTLFKFGEWVQLKSRYLFATSSDEKTGGEQGQKNMSTYIGIGAKEHVLTINEIPSHNHALAYQNTDGHYGGSSTEVRARDTTSGRTTTYETGGGQGHPHDVPYIAVYVWQRTK